MVGILYRVWTPQVYLTMTVDTPLSRHFTLTTLHSSLVGRGLTKYTIMPLFFTDIYGDLVSSELAYGDIKVICVHSNFVIDHIQSHVVPILVFVCLLPFFFWVQSTGCKFRVRRLGNPQCLTLQWAKSCISTIHRVGKLFILNYLHIRETLILLRRLSSFGAIGGSSRF